VELISLLSCRGGVKNTFFGFRNLTTDDCPVNEYAFYSTHTHDVTGKDFKVRHMAVGLIFNPIDRSARLSAAKAARKKTDPKA